MAVLPILMPLSEYWSLLDRHDWFFEYSDDARVWQRGEEAKKELLRIAAQSPEHAKLLHGFQQHHFNGVSWNTPEQPKPERPK